MNVPGEDRRVDLQVCSPGRSASSAASPCGHFERVAPRLLGSTIRSRPGSARSLLSTPITASQWDRIALDPSRPPAPRGAPPRNRLSRFPKSARCKYRLAAARRGAGWAYPEAPPSSVIRLRRGALDRPSVTSWPAPLVIDDHLKLPVALPLISRRPPRRDGPSAVGESSRGPAHHLHLRELFRGNADLSAPVVTKTAAEKSTCWRQWPAG